MKKNRANRDLLFGPAVDNDRHDIAAATGANTVSVKNSRRLSLAVICMRTLMRRWPMYDKTKSNPAKECARPGHSIVGNVCA